jgi:hypothetical protein
MLTTSRRARLRSQARVRMYRPVELRLRSSPRARHSVFSVCSYVVRNSSFSKTPALVLPKAIQFSQFHSSESARRDVSYRNVCLQCPQCPSTLSLSLHLYSGVTFDVSHCARARSPTNTTAMCSPSTAQGSRGERSFTPSIAVGLGSQSSS